MKFKYHSMMGLGLLAILVAGSSVKAADEISTALRQSSDPHWSITPMAQVEVGRLYADPISNLTTPNETTSGQYIGPRVLIEYNYPTIGLRGQWDFQYLRVSTPSPDSFGTYPTQARIQGVLGIAYTLGNQADTLSFDLMGEIGGRTSIQKVLTASSESSEISSSRTFLRFSPQFNFRFNQGTLAHVGLRISPYPQAGGGLFSSNELGAYLRIKPRRPGQTSGIVLSAEYSRTRIEVATGASDTVGETTAFSLGYEL